MVRSKSAKRFEILAHTVMIFITDCIVLPFIPVSYTHLDVYKRQTISSGGGDFEEV